MKEIFSKTLYTVLLSAVLAVPLSAGKADKISITDEQAEMIAFKIWQNEAAGNLNYLIFWNQNEPFLSLGLAHFLWYGKHNRNRYQEMFPKLVAYLAQHNVRLPDWLDADTPCPWENREAFLEAKTDNISKYQDLYRLLVRTMPIQVDFIVERMQQSLPKMLSSLNSDAERQHVREAYQKVLHRPDGSISPLGLYAIIDYVNFKGEGTSLDERYQGEGWGLLQVLLEMDTQTDNPQKAFADAAKNVLSKRIKNAPPDRNESRWEKGWFKRVESYAE